MTEQEKTAALEQIGELAVKAVEKELRGQNIQAAHQAFSLCRELGVVPRSPYDYPMGAVISNKKEWIPFAILGGVVLALIVLVAVLAK